MTKSIRIAETKWGQFKSAFIIGIVWVVWHLPLFAMLGTYQQQYLNVGIFALWTIGLSFILAGIYIYRRNVLLCLLAHCLINSLGEIYIPSQAWAEGITKLCLGIIVFIVFIKAKSKEKARS